MSRKLSENEIDEIQAVIYFIKYVNFSYIVPEADLWSALLALDAIINKYFVDYYDLDEVKAFIEEDDKKELYEKFNSMIRKKLEI